MNEQTRLELVGHLANSNKHLGKQLTLRCVAKAKVDACQCLNVNASSGTNTGCPLFSVLGGGTNFKF